MSASVLRKRAPDLWNVPVSVSLEGRFGFQSVLLSFILHLLLSFI